MTRLSISSTHTVADVVRLLRTALDEADMTGEYFSVSNLADQPFWTLVEDYRWIACYAVTGDSEGHYIHIDLVRGYGRTGSGECLHLITGKTFMGLAHALQIANRCAVLLGV